MKLGTFSISLNVRDINASRQFYETLGFEVFSGSPEQKFLIMKNENTYIGLFQGMFTNNILTFNPGWDTNAQPLEKFEDVRDIQQKLKAKNLRFEIEADVNTSGPAHCMLLDPDGNTILFDQHV